MIYLTRIHPDAVVPSQANPGDAGFDLSSIEDKTIQPGEYTLVKTGLKIALPDNHEGQVRPRSGLALKHGVTVLNTPGTIDAGYRGEVGVILINLGKKPFYVKKLMKIAQLVVARFASPSIAEVTPEYFDNMSGTQRGGGGFGSTGV